MTVPQPEPSATADAACPSTPSGGSLYRIIGFPMHGAILRVTPDSSIRPPSDLNVRYGEERLPRYTSYPTAPHFSNAITPHTYRQWLAAIPQQRTV